MSLEDRIRDAGRQHLRSYVPSGGLDQRIAEHTTRRMRRRRRQLGVTVTAGAVASWWLYRFFPRFVTGRLGSFVAGQMRVRFGSRPS